MSQVLNQSPSSCWRYEHSDGGGPWFKPDGTPRDPNNVPVFEEGIDALYGCDTLEHLNKYMARHGVDTSDMHPVHYLDIEVIDLHSETGHMTFRLKSNN